MSFLKGTVPKGAANHKKKQSILAKDWKKFIWSNLSYTDWQGLYLNNISWKIIKTPTKVSK